MVRCEVEKLPHKDSKQGKKKDARQGWNQRRGRANTKQGSWRMWGLTMGEE